MMYLVSDPARRRFRPVVAALLTAAMAVAACSGGDSDDQVAADQDPTTDSSRSSTSDRDSTTMTTNDSTDTSTSAGSSTTAATGTPGTPAPNGATPGSTVAPTSGPTSPSATAGQPATLASARIRVREVARFSVPISYRLRPGGGAYIAEQGGRVRDFATGAVVLDIAGVVVSRGEQGLLGITFSADGSSLYVSYSERASGGDTVIAEYSFAGGTADPGTRREIFRLDQPFANHNGGDIHLGPDGFLYIALGDGGSGGDPQENGQNTDTLLGSILRIDPTRPSEGRPYGIPADNPFVGGGGAPEIYLYGVRNPWRFSFDPATDDLWVADVGQNMWEEITVLPSAEGRGRGANLGWDNLEGTRRFEGGAPAGSTPPVYEYSHDNGCSITGGFVYRGGAIPSLQGAYLFADVCTTDLRAVRADGRRLVDQASFDVDVGAAISFGIEASGEILVLSQGGPVYRIEPA